MKLTLEEFLGKNKPAGRSKLDRFINEIFELKNQGFSLDQILDFLSINEVKVSKSTLHFFIKNKISTYKESPKKSFFIEKNNSTTVEKFSKQETSKKEQEPTAQKKIKLSVSEKSESTESKKIKSDYEIPSYAPKSLKNIDDLI